MAAPTITSIKNGIQTRLATIAGLRSTAFVSDQVNPPWAVVDCPYDIDPHGTFKGGLLQFEATVTLLVTKTVDRIGEEALNEYSSASGTNSIQLAIEGDPTLGGVVHSCYVRNFRRLTSQEVGEIGFYGGVFTLPILAAGA